MTMTTATRHQYSLTRHQNTTMGKSSSSSSSSYDCYVVDDVKSPLCHRRRPRPIADVVPLIVCVSLPFLPSPPSISLYLSLFLSIYTSLRFRFSLALPSASSSSRFGRVVLLSPAAVIVVCQYRLPSTPGTGKW